MSYDASSACWAIVPAAGCGSRMASQTPKQYLHIDDKPVLAHTLEKLLLVRGLKGIVVAIDRHDQYWHSLALAHHPKVQTVIGGAERADSVRQALQALQLFAGPDDWVLVHDAARPCVRVADIEHLLLKLQGTEGGLLAAPLNDTIKQVVDGVVVSTLDRRLLWAAQTPQCYRRQALSDALEQAQSNGLVVTDETSAMEHAGVRAQVVPGRLDNIKITRPEDLGLAQAILRHQAEQSL